MISAGTIHIAVNRKYVNKYTGDDWWTFNNSFTNEYLTVDQLIEAIERGRAFTAPHRHEHPVINGKEIAFRHRENWIEAQHIGADHDNLAIADALELPFVRDYATFIYTTPSHTDSTPRCRSVFILDQVITDQEYYNQGQKAIAWHLAGKVDRACTDAARLFYGSRCCTTFRNGKTLSLSALEQLIKEYIVHEQAHPQSSGANSGTPADEETERVHLAIAALSAARARDYTDWLHIGMALHDWNGVGAFDLWDQFSRKAPDKYGGTEEKWQSFQNQNGKRYTIATVFDYADSDTPEWWRRLSKYTNGHNGNGCTVPVYTDGFVVDTPEPIDFAEIKPAKTKKVIVDGDDELPQTLPSERIENDLETWGYAFSMCELDDTIEVNGRRIDDITAAKMRTDARDHGYGGKYGTPLTAMEDIVRVLAARNSYHPVRRYLDDLKWDNQDHFAALAAHLKDKHSPIVYNESTREPVVKVFLWRWMLGAVAKAYTTEGAVKPQNPMLVLSGTQGLGKSTFASWICPLPELFIESSIDPDSGDHLRYLVTKWIWEVGELGATTRRSDREALKSFLTKQEATFRKPYDHHPVIKPSLASFIGTVNPMNTGFLDDPTGSRRFLVTELLSIDHSYIKTVDVHQVWAQVVATYRDDPQAWRLLPIEDEKRLSINSENEVERPYEGLLSHIFDIDPLRTDWWMPTHEIADAIKTYGDAVFDETRHHGVLGATLRGLGLERKQKMVGADRLWGYYGIALRDVYKSILAGPPP